MTTRTIRAAIFGLVALLVACPSAAPPRVETIALSAQWGDAPLGTELSWRVDPASDGERRCEVHLEPEERLLHTLDPCPSAGSVALNLAEPGRHRVRFVASNTAGSDARSIEVFVNQIEFADNVWFLEKLPGFVRTERSDDEVRVELEPGAFAPDIQPDQVLWSTSGGGFVRRVTSVRREGQTLILTTRAADLSDAIRQGFFGMIQPVFDTQQDLLRTPATLTVQTEDGGSAKLSASRRQLRVDGRGCVSETWSGVRVQWPNETTPTFILEPSLEIGFCVSEFVVDISWFGLEELVLDLQSFVELSAELETKLSARLVNARVDLGEFLVGVVPVGPFVFTAKAKPSVTLRVDASLEFTMEALGEVSGGVRFAHRRDRRLNVEPSFRGSWSFSPPNISPSEPTTILKGKLSISPGIGIKLQDLAGPFLHPYLALHANASAQLLPQPQLCFDIDGAIEGSASFEANWFGFGFSAEVDLGSLTRFDVYDRCFEWNCSGCGVCADNPCQAQSLTSGAICQDGARLRCSEHMGCSLAEPEPCPSAAPTASTARARRVRTHRVRAVGTTSVMRRRRPRRPAVVTARVRPDRSAQATRA